MIDQKTHYFKKEDVLYAADGRWVEILGCLAPQLMPALEKAGRHVPCPCGTGSKDGFRVFKDVAEKGRAVSNSEGVLSSGVSLLMWVNSWDFLTTLNEVGEFLGLEPKEKWKAKQQRLAAVGKATTPAPAPKAATPTPAKPSSLSYLAAKNGDIDVGMEGEGASSAMPVFDPNLPPLDSYDDAMAAHASMEMDAPAVMTACGAEVSWGGAPQAPETGRIDVQQPAAQQKPVSTARKAAHAKLLDIQTRLKERSEQSSQAKSEKIEKVWRESVSILSPAAKPARDYLANRGIRLGSARYHALTDNDALRFHPALPYYDVVVVEEPDSQGNLKKVEKVVNLGEFPVLICAIKDQKGELVTLHRTYLTKKGGKKARVECPRKMLPVPDSKTITGEAIPLANPVNGVLGVAEGLETALSGYRATGIPTWPTVNANMLENFNPPKGVHTLLVWADKDKSMTGELSASILKERMEKKGVKVVVLLPSQPIAKRAKGIDWNDVLLEHGLSGFPLKRRLIQLIGQDF